jgi:hypothetical protein
MADDYSDIATPVDKVDDYSQIATPVSEEKKPSGWKAESEQLEADARKNLKAGLKLENVSLANTFSPASMWRGIKIALGDPWGSYVKSVDQGFKGPEIPRVEAEPGTDLEKRAGQVGAGLDNTVGGAASGLVSPGAAAAVINPATLLYSAPRFIAGGLEGLYNAVKPGDQGLQERVESGAGGALQLLGAKVGAKAGVKGINLADLKPAKPSITSAVDAASSKTNPFEANDAANQIAMGKTEPEPIKEAVNDTGVEEPQKLKEPELGPEATKLSKVAGGQEKLDTIVKELKNPNVKIQYSVWDKDMVPKGGDRTMQVDLIDETRQDTPGGLASTNRALLNELGIDAPKAPDSLPPGRYTLDEIKAAIAKEKAPADDLISNFDKEWVDQGRQGGSENQIIKKDGLVYKRNYNEGLGKAIPNHGNIEALNEHVELHNELFPETKLKFEGMSETSDGPAPVFSQVEIKGKDATPKEIREFMAKKGFEPYSGSAYINPDLGIRVGDLKGDNVIKDANGVLHVIDPVIKKLASSDTDYSGISEPVVKEAPVAAAPKFTLPKDLAGAKPRYSYGANQFTLKFESDLDRSLYILAQKKPSARDADYLKLVMDHMGLDEEEARAAGAEIRNQIKQQANSAADGETLIVPDSELKPSSRTEKSIPQTNAVQVKSPESVPVPAQAQASEEVVPEVRSGEQTSQPRQEAQVASGGSGGQPPVPPGQAPAPTPSFNSPLPYQGWTPFISKTKLGQQLKVLIGTIEGNIRKVAPEVFGSLRERGYKLNELKKSWHDTSKDYGEIARNTLKPEAFEELDRMLQNGQFDKAYNYIKRARNEPELRASIDSFRKTLDSLRQAEIESGRDVGEIDNYWIREVADYKGLRKALGKDQRHAAELAMMKAADAKGRPLTTEEEAQVINNLISTSINGQGKPGFLNPRTISEIQKNWFKYYEPSDVAMENRIARVSKDVVNRAYFGKFDPQGVVNAGAGRMGAIEGHFGDIINRLIKERKLSPDGSKIVVRNLQDFLKNESGYDETSAGIANKLRKAQTYAYLGDFANAIPQYGDFFLAAWRNGLFDASKGFTNRRFKLSDINVHEGNPDTAVFSKKNNEGLVGKVFRNSVNLFLGVSDRFNKGGLLNASFHEAARDMRDPNSATYKQLDAKWSERFPRRWPEIKKDLQSPAFAKGELNPNTRFFLYSELADLQPISGEATAQGYNRSGPWGKIMYGLRSFAIKQIDVMRQEGYEKMRDPKTRAEGIKNLATYALVVGAGQQLVGSYLRDKLLDRETDPSEYAVSGLLQLMGFNRYSLYRAKEQGVGTAAIEMAVPGIGIANDLTQSTGVMRDFLTGRRSQKTGAKTVPSFVDAVKQMEATKYIPGFGRELYSWFGLGKTKETTRRQQKAQGHPSKTTVQQLSEMIIPPDKKE